MAKNELVPIAEAYPIIAGNAEMQEIIEANLGDSEMSAFDLDHIKVPAGGSTVWEVPGLAETKSTKSLEGIIACYQDVRAYWESESTGSAPPDCASNDCKVGIGLPGGACMECLFSKFKSARKGEGQACKAMRRLFLLLPGQALPMVLTLPPTSLKACKQYMLRLTSARVRSYGCITEITLEKVTNANGDNYAKCIFGTDESKLMAPDEIEISKAYSDQIKALVASKTIALDDYSGVAV